MEKESKRPVEFWCTGLTEEEYKKRREEYESKHCERFSWAGVDADSIEQIDRRSAEHRELYAKEFVDGVEKTCYIYKRKERAQELFITGGSVDVGKTSRRLYRDTAPFPLEVKPVKREFFPNFSVKFNLCYDCQVLFGFEEDPDAWLRRVIDSLEI